MRTEKHLNRLAELSLNIANYIDYCGQEGDTRLSDELELDYRALSGYLRTGARAVIEIQEFYHQAIRARDFAEDEEMGMRDFLKEIWGDEEPKTLNDEHKQKIKEFVGTLLKEMGENDKKHE